MKKLILIGLVIVSGMILSCEKQDINPRNDNRSNVPVWEGNRCESPTIDNTKNGAKPEGNGTGITDPNNDEDGNGRKKV